MKPFFFLGGHDLEMLAIRDLLSAHAAGRFLDKGLTWGARASAYQQEIAAARARGDTPVLVELVDDLKLSGVILIDHHGAAAGASTPTALEQIFALLKLPSNAWSRWLALVAANDRGHVAALRALGASPEEINRVRSADRAAQGITAAEEAAAATACEHAESLAEGHLTRVRLAHGRTAAVTDRLDAELGGPGYQNLLIESPGEVNFFGEGALVQGLGQRFPTGWSGGDLPLRGFFGLRTLEPARVLDELLASLQADQDG